MRISFHLRPLFFLLSLFLLIAPGLARAADDVVWSGLIYATTVKNPAPAPKELAAYSRRLQNIFGYNQLQLLSQHREIMDAQSEHWLLPGKDFCLRIDTKKGKETYRLNLQLYQEDRLLVQSEVQLAPKSPIFLRGPLYDKGQLIIVLAVE